MTNGNQTFFITLFLPILLTFLKSKKKLKTQNSFVLELFKVEWSIIALFIVVNSHI
jgi:hypothetical protein